MKHIWHSIGKGAFWLLWPALFIYLWFTKRTRILVVVGHEVLLIKGWLSSGRWGLPGGGLHAWESPEKGAQRELQEETGITVGTDQFHLLHSQKARSSHGHQFFAYTYVLELPEKPELHLQKGEITDAKWVSWQNLNDMPKVMKEVSHTLASWRQTR